MMFLWLVVTRGHDIMVAMTEREKPEEELLPSQQGNRGHVHLSVGGFASLYAQMKGLHICHHTLLFRK